MYSICTKEFRVLEKHFFNTLKDDWEMHIEFFPRGGSFQTDEWYAITRRKIQILINAISSNWGHVIVWCDLDIQFFKSCSNTIHQCLENKDIAFQCESFEAFEKCLDCKINSGFMAIRCNESALSFFGKILKIDFSRLPYGDQSAINTILLQEPELIRWTVFPDKVWAMSQGGWPPEDIILHHANCAATPEEKLKQFKAIRRRLWAARLGLRRLVLIKNC